MIKLDLSVIIPCTQKEFHIITIWAKVYTHKYADRGTNDFFYE